MNDPVSPRLPWSRVVELATQLEGAYLSRGEVDSEIAVRLARAVLDFQEQLLGGLVRPVARSR
jgi:hypothetical protein